MSLDKTGNPGNPGNSENPGNLSRREFLKVAGKVAGIVAASVVMTACGGNTKEGGPILNNSLIEVDKIEEGKEISISFYEIVKNFSSSNNNKISVNVDNIIIPEEYNDFIKIDEDKKEIIFTAPNVEEETKFLIFAGVKDSNGKKSNDSVQIIFTALDELDDNPLSAKLTNVKNKIKEGEDFHFTLEAEDDDGISSTLYVLKEVDDNGNELGLISSGDANIGKNTISDLKVGKYKLTVLVVGEDGGEGYSSEKKLTHSLNVVENLGVEITNIDIPESINIGDELNGDFEVPNTSDKITKVSYVIKDSSGNEIVRERVFEGEDISENGKYIINEENLPLGEYIIIINAEDADGSEAETVRRTVKVKEVNNAPVIDEIGTITVNDDGGGANKYVTTVTGNNILPGATFSIVSGPVPALTIDGNTGEMRRNGNESGDDSYSVTVKVTNPGTGGLSDTQNFTLNVIDNI